MPKCLGKFLFSIGGVELYKEGVVHGLIQSLRFLSVILAGISFFHLYFSNQILEV